jgi:tRNA (mo5U34)-methyltransferase
VFRRGRVRPSPDELSRIQWFHSIDLGDGLVTPGSKSAPYLEEQLAALELPDLRGKTVLDIGAWDGFFSFEAERMGAARVVALDYHVWGLDMPAYAKYIEQCQSQGVIPQTFGQAGSWFRPKELPGRAGFDLAHRALGSCVEPVVGDFMSMDLSTLGTFDVVFFLGVLYHLENPFLGLRRLAQLTSALSIIGSVCVEIPGAEDRQVWEFFENDELSQDPSNWWAGNAAALQGVTRAAGFSRVELKSSHAPGSLPREVPGFHYTRAILHATV